jgi:Zn-dependent peptidase ImmA (M78 family)/DNA-binding XRE family transcriptional regulator
MFNPTRLSVARRRRGWTKTRLAAKTGLTVRSITEYEAGRTDPLPETVDRLAVALTFPVAFFRGYDLDEVTPDAASFRALSKLTASKRDQALAAATLALELHRWLSERFRLPQADLPLLDGEDAERAAEVVRTEWKLGEKPVANMVHLLEAHGVRVFSLAEEYAEADAFSFWYDGFPFVFLNTMKSAERSRMDAAHELAHLVLHRRDDEIPRGREVELDAKRFASAFLMPRAGVLPAAPPFATLEQLVVEKKRWKVSVAALALRLHELGVFSDWHYRSIYMDISRRGYRKKEPHEMRRETSQVLKKILRSLKEEGIGKPEIAAALDLPLHELNALMFGLVMTSVDGNGETPSTTPDASPALRVVGSGANQ